MQKINQTKIPILLVLISLLPIANAIPFRPLSMPITIFLILTAILSYFLAGNYIYKDIFKGIILVLILSIIAALAIFLSPIELNMDIQFFKKFIKYVVFLLAIPIFSHQIKSIKNVKKILFLLLIGVSIVCIYGLFINYNIHNFRNPVNVFLYTSVSQNSLGNWTPAIFLIGLYLLIDKENKYKFLTLLLLFIIIATQTLTISRVGYFMIFISFFIWWAVFLNLKQKTYSLIFLLLISYGVINTFPNQYEQAIKRMDSLTTVPKIIQTSTGRAVNFVKGYDAFINYPILGIGLSNFQFYKTETIDTKKTMGRVNEEDSHSIFIDAFAELGIIGVFILLYFFIPILLYKKRNHMLYGDVYLLSKFCVWFIMLRGFTSDDILSNPVNMLVFAIALYLSRDQINYDQKFVK